LAVAYETLAVAQDAPPRFELTPYAAYLFGGDFEAESGDRTFELREGKAQGLVFNIRAADVSAQWEAQAELQSWNRSSPASGNRS